MHIVPSAILSLLTITTAEPKEQYRHAREVFKKQGRQVDKKLPRRNQHIWGAPNYSIG
jgi:hypothetical protein